VNVGAEMEKTKRWRRLDATHGYSAAYFAYAIISIGRRSGCAERKSTKAPIDEVSFGWCQLASALAH
jgi:hypothetical protein